MSVKKRENCIPHGLVDDAVAVNVERTVGTWSSMTTRTHHLPTGAGMVAAHLFVVKLVQSWNNKFIA